jgi:hypothetical protein
VGVLLNTTPTNQPPVIDNQSFGVAENSPSGMVVGTVAASDPDARQALSYQITAGNTGGAFALDASTGQLTVANGAALDFETTPVFTVAVRVTDNGSPARSSTATITIRLDDIAELLNQPPTIGAQEFAINENAANGTVVGTVAASDPDAGQTLTYQITAGNTAGSTSGVLAINSNTGELTVANGAALDFETTPVFILTVQATDNGSPAMSSTAKITVKLNDVNENTNESPTGSQAVANNNTPTLSSAAGNEISGLVPDTGAALIQVSLRTSHGKLTLARTAGLTFQVGDGKSDRATTFRGTSSAVKAALESLRYIPAKGYVGTDRIAITMSDPGSIRRPGRVLRSRGSRPLNIHQERVVLSAHRPAVGSDVVAMLVEGKK